MDRRPSSTLKAWSGWLRSTYPRVASLLLQFDDCCIEVQVNRLELLDRLAEYFSPFVAPAAQPGATVSVHEGEVPEIPGPLQAQPPGPGKSRVKEEYCDLPDGRLVRKRQTGLVLAFNGENHFVAGPCLDNVNQVVNFINHLFIASKLRQGGLLAHAAGVELQQRGLALAGASGSGKSTLALQLLERGASYVSNDRLVLLETPSRPVMFGVAKWPRVNPGTILHAPQLRALLSKEEMSRYAGMDASELWSLERKFDVYPEHHFGPGRITLHSELHGAVLLNWRLGGGACRIRQVDLASRPDLLAVIKKRPGVFFREQGAVACDFSDRAYLRLLHSCPCLELYGGVDFETAAEACADLLQVSFASGKADLLGF